MNKEHSWDDCIKSNSSISITPDISKAKSLISIASGRSNFLKKIEIDETNSNYIFEGHYSTALEILHAILILDGYKVNNHICLGFYLRDTLKKEKLFRVFDDCRYKRNSLIYYGHKMDFDIAKKTIENCLNLITELLLLANKLSK